MSPVVEFAHKSTTKKMKKEFAYYSETEYNKCFAAWFLE